MSKIFVFLLSYIVSSSCICCANKEEKSLWYIDEVFVKFGKKEAYENLEKQWLSSFKSFFGEGGIWRTKKHTWQFFALQAMNEPQYMFFIPMENFSDLGDYFAKKNEFMQVPSKELAQMRQSLASMTNFAVNSLHMYLPGCSRVEGADGDLWSKYPNLYFYSFGISPGNESIFENHLQTIASDKKITLSHSVYRVWKVLIGSDLPKYLILISSESDDQLKIAMDSLNFITPELKDIIRNRREGQALYKKDLN